MGGHEIGVQKLGAIRFPFNTINIGPDFDLALRLEAQGIHIRWLYLAIPGFRTLFPKLEKEGKVLNRDYFPELKCVWVTGELSKSLLDHASKLFGVPIVVGSAVNDGWWRGDSCYYGWEEDQGARMYMHWPEDTHFVEVFPWGSDKPQNEADIGEPVFTNLVSKAMVYIRFRSGDLYRCLWAPCPHCGYTQLQARVLSRISESVNVGGKIVAMGEIEDVLYSFPECRVYPTQLIRESLQPQARLRLRVSYNTELVKDPDAFKQGLVAAFKEGLGVGTEIELISPDEVKAFFHKYQRVIHE
jgi:phenylacetate-coenzyme A ligase PaaK-like adenylate-forming protein